MKSLKSKIKQELTKLWTGELVAVLSFWICFFYFQKVDFKYKNVNFSHISVDCIEFYPYSRLNILVNSVKETIHTAICYNKYKKNIQHT